MTDLVDRIAAAPISWGVWEANGASGWTVDPDTYLRQVKELGIAATEFGPVGYLPRDPAARKAKLDEYGLQALGAFTPLMLFHDDYDPLPEVETELEAYVASGASTFIIATLSGAKGYNDRPVLDQHQWDVFFRNLDRVCKAARSKGITPTLHHHMGMVIQTIDDVENLFQHSDIGLCLDTGHATIAGFDPIDVVERYPDRINFVHLKDVNIAKAREVQAGKIQYMDALDEGIFQPLGKGEVGIDKLVHTLESTGYTGWYVMEQDVVLQSETDLPAALADVKTSVEYLRGLAD